MKNTGRPSEEEFDNVWKALGKLAFVFKFTDASEAYGTNKRVVKIKAQPSDRIVTYKGRTWYAEVKSTTDPGRFPFSLLRTTQGAFAAQVMAAGGDYIIYIHSIAHNLWYAVPYRVLEWAKLNNKASLTWTELSSHLWIKPTP